MSKTHCRFCKETFEGIYMHCPKCKRNLIPKEYQSATPANTTPQEEERE